MPMYDYVCSVCKHTFESLNSIMNRDNEECPRCQQIAALAEIQGVNPNLAKTKYTPPDKASRKFGDMNVTPAKRARWV